MKASIYGKQKRIGDNILLGLINLATFFSLLVLVVIIGYIVVNGVPAFRFKYLTSVTSVLNETYGLLPNIINTLYVIILTMLIVIPIGIGGAIYLEEYAKNRKLINLISFTTEILSGIPSIVYGLFGMIFFGQVLGLNYSILTGSLTLAIMILPIISRNTQVALQGVPKSYREAALGMGATKWYMIRTALLPSAMPGILTGAILGLGRIIAESAALIFTAGSGLIMPRGVLAHLFDSGGTLTVQLYLEMTKANYDHAFIIALILIGIILLLNSLAKYIGYKFDVERK